MVDNILVRVRLGLWKSLHEQPKENLCQINSQSQQRNAEKQQNTSSTHLKSEDQRNSSSFDTGNIMSRTRKQPIQGS